MYMYTVYVNFKVGLNYKASSILSKHEVEQYQLFTEYMGRDFGETNVNKHFWRQNESQ